MKKRYHEYSRKPTCPYCDNEHDDAWDWDLEEDRECEVQCENCEKEFIIIPECTWSYTSFKS